MSAAPGLTDEQIELARLRGVIARAAKDLETGESPEDVAADLRDATKGKTHADRTSVETG